MSLDLTEVQERQLRTIVYALETNITNYDHTKQERSLINTIAADSRYNDARRSLWNTVEEARVLYHELKNSYPDQATLGSDSDEKEEKKGLICVLFLAANPTGSPRLALEEEVREIDKVLRESGYRDQFDFRQQWAVRPQELQGYLLRYKPAIVHFSGHGTAAGEILLQNDAGKMEPVSVQILNELFANFKDTVRCVVLNACFSETQSKVMANHIDCVVGMSDSMGDSAAQAFSTAFYQAIGWGKDIKTAFDLGCNQIRLLKLPDPSVPRLLAKKRDPRTIIIAKPV